MSGVIPWEQPIEEEFIPLIVISDKDREFKEWQEYLKKKFCEVSGISPKFFDNQNITIDITEHEDKNTKEISKGL